MRGDWVIGFILFAGIALICLGFAEALSDLPCAPGKVAVRGAWKMECVRR